MHAARLQKLKAAAQGLIDAIDEFEDEEGQVLEFAENHDELYEHNADEAGRADTKARHFLSGRRMRFFGVRYQAHYLEGCHKEAHGDNLFDLGDCDFGHRI